MKDKSVWTNEPEYERFLHVRVFKPEEIEERELRCTLAMGDQTHKTDMLDPPEEPEVGGHLKHNKFSFLKQTLQRKISA